MNIPNGLELIKFRGENRTCEICKKLCRRTCPAHVLSVGSGRIDDRRNLVRVGRDPFEDCSCHQTSHYNQTITQARLFAIVAAREGLLAETLKPALDAVKACPRFSTMTKVRDWIRDHFDDREQVKLAIQIVSEWGGILE